MNIRFPGQWFQLETGLAYNWHRHYDATLGRYLQPDPLGLRALMSDGPSAYGYVGGNPLAYSDPRGEFIWGALGWFAVGAVGDLIVQYRDLIWWGVNNWNKVGTPLDERPFWNATCRINWVSPLYSGLSSAIVPLPIVSSFWKGGAWQYNGAFWAIMKVGPQIAPSYNPNCNC